MIGTGTEGNMSTGPLELNCLPGAANWYQTDVIDISKSGDLLAVGSKDTVMVVNVDNCTWMGGICCHARKKTTCVRWFSYSTVSRKGIIISAGTDGMIRVLSVNTHKKEIKILKTHKFGKSSISSLDITNKGNLAAAFGGTLVLGTVDLENEEAVKFRDIEKKEMTSEQITSVVLFKGSSHDSTLAVGCSDGTLFLLNERKIVFKWTSIHKAAIQSCSWSILEAAHGSSFLLLASGSLDEKIALWKINTKSETWTYLSHKLTLTGICQTGAQAASAQSGKNRVWNATSWCTLPLLENLLYTTCGSNFVVLVWDLSNLIRKWCSGSPPGQPSKPQVFHRPRTVFSIKFANGPTPYAITSSLDPNISKFSVSKSEGGKLKEILSIPCIKSSPSQLVVGKSIVVCGGNNELIIWKVPDGHHDNAVASKGKQLNYKHKRHWAMINTSATSLHVDETSKKVYFALKSGDVGVASVDLQEKGSGVTQKSSSQIYCNLSAEVNLIHLLGKESLLCISCNNKQTNCLVMDIKSQVGSYSKIQLTKNSILAASYKDSKLFIATDDTLIGFYFVFDERSASWKEHQTCEVNYTSVSSAGKALHIASQVTSFGLLVAFTCDNGCISILSTSEKGNRLYPPKGIHSKLITSTSWMGSENRFVTSSLDASIIFWSVSDSDLAPTHIINASFPIINCVVSHSDVLYAASDLTVFSFVLSDATEVGNPQCDFTSHKGRYKTSTRGISDSSQVKRQKVTKQRFISASEWLGGMNGSNRQLIAEGDIETRDRINIVRTLLGEKCDIKPSLGGAIYCGNNINESIQLSSGEIGAGLRLLTGDAEGAAEMIIKQSPTEAGFWIGLTRHLCGEQTWRRLLTTWCENSSNSNTKTIFNLCFGMFTEAATHLLEIGDFESLKLVVEKFRVALPDCRKNDFLQSSAVTKSDSYPLVLVAFGLEEEAFDILSVSSNTVELLYAFSLKPSVDVSDKIALRWLIGDPATRSITLPPNGGSDGGVHSAFFARRSLVISKSELIKEICENQNPSQISADLKRWMTAVKMSEVAEQIVSSTIDILAGASNEIETS